MTQGKCVTVSWSFFVVPAEQHLLLMDAPVPRKVYWYTPVSLGSALDKNIIRFKASRWHSISCYKRNESFYLTFSKTSNSIVHQIHVVRDENMLCCYCMLSFPFLTCNLLPGLNFLTAPVDVVIVLFSVCMWRGKIWLFDYESILKRYIQYILQ